MELRNIKAVYFIGIGGIGMSAIARFFIRRGMVVGGYDRTPTRLTARLAQEGALIHYDEDTAKIPVACRDKASTLVVYTPAVPQEHKELAHFRSNGFCVEKRAQVLGMLTRAHKGLCVAGTHGKTTTSAMCAHIMHQSHIDCNAFLGGICKNYASNYIVSDKSDYVVIEADEFDRSFHWLRPWMSVITSTDADHLDIYGTEDAYIEAFEKYSSLIKPGGALILHRGLKMRPRVQEGVRVYGYGLREGDFHAEDINIGDGKITFTFVSPVENIHGVRLGAPIPVNIENGVAAMAMAQLCGCDKEELLYGMSTYKGVDRRFDFKINDGKTVLLSDYAHHPREIAECARSIRRLFNGRHITAIFQPHLYSRTRDFYKDFAGALGHFDRVVLTDIYPARELPIPGVSPRLIYDNLPPEVEKTMIHTNEVQDYVSSHDLDVTVVLGAGDLDDQVPDIERILRGKHPGK